MFLVPGSFRRLAEEALLAESRVFERCAAFDNLVLTAFGSV